MGWGDVATKAAQKADDVYRLLITAQTQIGHLVEQVKGLEQRLVSTQQAFHQQVWQELQSFEGRVTHRLDEFGTRLRELEREQNKMQGLVHEPYAKAVAMMAEEARRRSVGETDTKVAAQKVLGLANAKKAEDSDNGD